MDNGVKDFLKGLLEELKRIDYVKPEDIPNIDLYMDQITTFMDEQLAASKRHENDKILTKTMINNYAKNHLLPSPDKKKYSKEHILLFFCEPVQLIPYRRLCYIHVYMFKNISKKSFS